MARDLKTTKALFTKLYTNINQHDLQSARMVTLLLILLELFSLELCPSQKPCTRYNLKTA